MRSLSRVLALLLTIAVPAQALAIPDRGLKGLRLAEPAIGHRSGSGVVVANVNREMLPLAVDRQALIGGDNDGLMTPGDVQIGHVVDADPSSESFNENSIKKRLHRNPFDGEGIEVVPCLQCRRDVEADMGSLPQDVGDFESQQVRSEGTVESAEDARKEYARVLGVFFPKKPLDDDGSVGDVEQRLTPVVAQFSYVRGRVAEGTVKRVSPFSPADDALVEILRSLRTRMGARAEGVDEAGDLQLVGFWEGFNPFDEIYGGHGYFLGHPDRTTGAGGRRSLPDSLFFGSVPTPMAVSACSNSSLRVGQCSPLVLVPDSTRAARGRQAVLAASVCWVRRPFCQSHK